MKASGWSFDEVTSDRVALVSPAGEVLGGNGPRHIEYPIHTEVMNARPDVNSVVHTHAPAAHHTAEARDQRALAGVRSRPLDHERLRPHARVSAGRACSAVSRRCHSDSGPGRPKRTLAGDSKSRVRTPERASAS